MTVPAQSPPSISYRKVHPDAELPSPGEPGAIGLDIAAFAINSDDRMVNIIIGPRATKSIRTGLVLLPPAGYFLLVCSRSSLAAAQPPIFVANAPGIVDPNFTGELEVILYNGGYDSVYIRHGQRIAQILTLPATRFPLTELAELPKTSRGDKGFSAKV